VLVVVVLAAFAAGCSENLSEADRSDPGILARLQANLQAHRELDLKYVTLDVHSGIVTVSGLVHTWDERRLVEKIVNDTGGYQQAVVNLAIQE
jgi:osmotically-inducible protein OsmY